MIKRKNSTVITIDNIKKSFLEKKYLEKAFTHPSYGGKDFQRLEFLGDRVLGLIISEELYNKYVDDDEGLLAKRYAYLTSGYFCAKIAKNLTLDKKIIVSKNLEINESILGDSMEALIGAIYLDRGIKHVENIILNLWKSEISYNNLIFTDSKTTLQEWSQSKNLGLPIYEITSKTGLAHMPFFKTKVNIKNYKSVLGKGNSKQNAELDAANNFMINNLGQDE